jgi:hypothetical protein
MMYFLNKRILTAGRARKSVSNSRITMEPTFPQSRRTVLFKAVQTSNMAITAREHQDWIAVKLFILGNCGVDSD